ncbi:MAG TPA: elongation factor P [Armatimonadota bacterium]|nr:elongation factor P [Armatimonadota bacterium]
MPVSTNEFKTGLTIEMDGQVYQIINYEHHKPGKGHAVVRTKLRDVKSGNVYDKTFRAGEKVETAHVTRKQMQYLYTDGSGYFFMDNESYDQMEISGDQVGTQHIWLKEGEDVDITMHEEELLGVEVKQTVERRVDKTDPGVRGDTATGGTKPAVLEGGATITVPLFVSEGDVLKVDTRNSNYITRV